MTVLIQWRQWSCGNGRQWRTVKVVKGQWWRYSAGVVMVLAAAVVKLCRGDGDDRTLVTVVAAVTTHRIPVKSRAHKLVHNVHTYCVLMSWQSEVAQGRLSTAK